MSDWLDTVVLSVAISAFTFLCGLALGRALEHEDAQRNAREWERLTHLSNAELAKCRKELWFYTNAGGDK